MKKFIFIFSLECDSIYLNFCDLNVFVPNSQFEIVRNIDSELNQVLNQIPLSLKTKQSLCWKALNEKTDINNCKTLNNPLKIGVFD